MIALLLEKHHCLHLLFKVSLLDWARINKVPEGNGCLCKRQEVEVKRLFVALKVPHHRCIDTFFACEAMTTNVAEQGLDSQFLLKPSNVLNLSQQVVKTWKFAEGEPLPQCYGLVQLNPEFDFSR